MRVIMSKIHQEVYFTATSDNTFNLFFKVKRFKASTSHMVARLLSGFV